MSQMHSVRGVRPDYYDITWGGGLSDLLQYYKGKGGGVSRDPKFVLHNIWTAPYISIVQYKTAVSTSSAVQPIERFPRNPAGRLLVVRLAPGIRLLALLSLARSSVAGCSSSIPL